MNIEKNIRFNDIGQEVTVKIQLKYKDLEVFEFPASCSKCPCGFSAEADCGRNVPFADEDYKSRPKTCKLKKISYVEVRHGKWLITDTFDHHKIPIYRCSICNKEVADHYINLHKYCLRCGAEMNTED